jgi:NADH dehydrogenase FAD-containing subunit
MCRNVNWFVTDDIQDAIHSQYKYKWSMAKLMWETILLRVCVYIHTHIYVHICVHRYIIIGTDNTQNDFYLQIHVHIYG